MIMLYPHTFWLLQLLFFTTVELDLTIKSCRPPKFTNMDALDGYRLGWATGDTDIILGVSSGSFNFTWVPDNDVVSRERFPIFFEGFVSQAEEGGQAKYFMKFDNIIHREVDL